ncbi:MAG: DUF362 domain-containing protein [Ruminococcaceae bacterium]|nr:DUF362 domain-containing protein [Oscillospiraceae bacterium]
MVLVQQCNTYDEEIIVEKVREIFTAHGGIEKYARPGVTVAIKPNIIGKKRPEEAATTHPSIVYAVASLCVQQGAKVVIAESPGGMYEKALLKGQYRVSGIEDAAVRAGAELNYDLTETEVDNPKGKNLKKIKVLTPLAQADCIINLAKFKTHGMMVYTGAVKNMFGAIAGLAKAEYHFNMSKYSEFADCLIDIHTAVKPALNIVDAVVGMHKDGPTAGEPIQMNTILSGCDAYEVDMVGLDIINCKYYRTPIMKQAVERGLVSDNIENIEVQGEVVKCPDFVVKYNDELKRLHLIDGMLGKTLQRLIKPRPVFHKKKCRGCGECVRACPAKVIHLDENKKAKVNLDGCIRCFCCQELCPFVAVEIKKPLLNRIVIRGRR